MSGGSLTWSSTLMTIISLIFMVSSFRQNCATPDRA
jgi:hypothetical protein